MNPAQERREAIERANVGERPTLTHDRPENEPQLLGPVTGIATIGKKLYAARPKLGGASPFAQFVDYGLGMKRHVGTVP